MKNQDCLSCKYEPDWGASKGIYQIRRGICKWFNFFKFPEKPKIPSCCNFIYPPQKGVILRYDDNSGLPLNCPTWEAKERESLK